MNVTMLNLTIRLYIWYIRLSTWAYKANKFLKRYLGTCLMVQGYHGRFRVGWVSFHWTYDDAMATKDGHQNSGNYERTIYSILSARKGRGYNPLLWITGYH